LQETLNKSEEQIDILKNEIKSTKKQY